MPKIKNSNNLATTSLRKTAVRIAEAGLLAIDTRTVIERNVKVAGDAVIIAGVPFRTDKTNSGQGKIYLVGIGKCASEAANTIENILGDKLSGGIVLDVKESETTSNRIKYFSGTHPFPSEQNVSVSKEIVRMLQTLNSRDLVIFIVSGGGSTLLCLPARTANVNLAGGPSENNTYVEEETILKALFSVGATIQEINTIRKHISHARGGYLAKYAYPARVVSLILSDVPGNDIGFIASGPTVKDETTIKDAEKILEKYNILKSCNLSGCGLIETPKDEKYFENVSNVLIVSNILALNAMHDEAIRLGFAARIVTDRIEGEAREVADDIVEEIHREPHRSVLLYGGETTVTVDKKGRGGRNGELALSALRFLEDGELVAAVASDGRDNGEYAGAIADLLGRNKAKQLGLDINTHLANHDPAPFFEQTGDYIMTGHTGSNVSDLLIAIKN